VAPTPPSPAPAPSPGTARDVTDPADPPRRQAPRLVATDLDGTLLRRDGTVSERTRAALARVEAAGATLVFVTGRPPRWLAPVVEQTGHKGLAVCANGAVLYDLHTERVVREHLLEPEAAVSLVQALRASLPDVAFAVERAVGTGGGVDASGFAHEPEYVIRYPLPDGVLVAAAEELVTSPVVKLLARHERLGPDDLLARAREVVGDLANLTHSSHDGLIEISASGVSKASGLAALAEEQGVTAEDVVAFGDMPNDLPMLDWSGHAVAVANAHPEVLAVVDEVTASHEEDGVARVLERLFP
jgi:HAD superfamily hydrolase (TIGR01484 family)